jgi:putative FmdB family regulatory protein
MPTYTYKCSKCKLQFETFQSIVDPPLEHCPSCHGRIERIITGGSGIIFKGSGFYITDYARKNTTEDKPVKKDKKAEKSSKKDTKS